MSLKATIALATALLLAGGAFDLASLYVPGIALAALAAGAAGWTLLAARGTTVERAAGPGTVVEREPFPVRVRIRGGLVPPRGELIDPLLGEPVPISASGRGGVRMGTARRGVLHHAEARLERRGRQPLEPPRLVIRDVLGLCSRRIEGRGGDEVLVLPRVEPVVVGGARSGEDGAAGGGAGDGAGGGLGGTADVEIDGLRPYRKGSPASRIHWPAVARHGDLIERSLVSGAEGTALVVVDAEGAQDGEPLDRALRAAASLCVHLAPAGGCALLLPGKPRPLRIDRQLRGWPQAHARLALVEAGGRVAGGARAPRGVTTFWVAAAPARLPRGLARGSFLVTPFAPDSGGAAFTVAGCHGVPIGTGRAARRSVRRAA